MAIFTKTKPQTTTLPDSLEQHPDWVKHTQRVNELATSLAAAQDAHTQLITERDRVHAAQQERAVQVVLGESVSAEDSPDAAVRLAELDGEIVRATARVSTIREAVRRLEALGADVRSAIEVEMREQIQRESRVAIARLGAALLDAIAANQALRRLESYGDLATLPAHSLDELAPFEWSRASRWLQQARAAGIDV